MISGGRLACLGGAEEPLHGGARRLEPPGDFVRRVLQRAIAGKRAIQFHGQAGAVVLENGNRLVALRPTGIGLRTRLRRLLQEIESTRKPLKRSIDRVGAGRLCHHSAGIRPRSLWRVNVRSGAIPCDQQGPSEPLASTGGGDLLSGASLAISAVQALFPPLSRRLPGSNPYIGAGSARAMARVGGKERKMTVKVAINGFGRIGR